MSKKVAVLAVNPVNGYGLFQYLESFFENQISYKVFAVAESKNIHTNSGIAIQADDIVSNLIGHADDFDALVFSCGDAIPVFAQHVNEKYNVNLMEVIKEFANKGKLIAGHCGAGLIFDFAGVTKGRKIAVHPYVKGMVKNGIATENSYEVDHNFYTAQSEHCISNLMPHLLDVLK